LDYSRIRLRGDIEESRVENGYADFRESLKLLTYSIHCCVESERTAAGGFAVLFAAQQAECRTSRKAGAGCSLGGWVWVQRLSHCKTQAGCLGPAAQKRFSATH